MNSNVAAKIYLPLLVSVALVMSGCVDKKKTTTTDNTPVVAKVNGTQFTEQQVNATVQRIANLDKSRTKEASIQVVRSLVDQEVLVQQAQKDKLDSDPKVKALLDAAQRQVLAQAYMEKKLGAVTTPTAAEVTAFYNQHPELFAQRKLYRIQEVAIKAPPGEYEAISAQLAASKSLNDFATWLKTKNYPVNGTQEVKAAEQLPAPLLTKLKDMPDGQATIVTTPEGLIVLVLAGSQLQPVTEAQAKPAIERLVQVQKRQQAAKQELDRLKAAAKIEYLGDYVEAGKPDSASASNATSTVPNNATDQAPANPATK